MTKAAARIHLLIIGLYLVLSLALTYPLVLHFTTHVPGSATWAFDEYTFLWNMWWFKYSIFDLQSNPLYSSFIFYPLGISLVLYTYHLHNALLSVPLQPLLSLSTINNVFLIGSLTLSGYGTFLLIKYLLTTGKDASPHLLPRKRRPDGSTILRLSLRPCSGQGSGERSPRCLVEEMAAFLGGVVYAFTASRFIYLALGHYNFASNHWIPFYTLYVIKTIREPRARNALWAGIFLTLTLSCEMTYGIFLAIFTIVYLLFTSREKIFDIQFAKRLGLLIITFLLTYCPMIYFVFKEMLSGGYTLEGWGDALKLSTDLLGFFTPTKLHPLWGGDWVKELRAVVEGTARFSDVNTVFIGYMTLVLAIFALLKYRRTLKVWGVAALISAILSMGPLLQINGQYLFDLDGLLAEARVTFPMPFALLHYLPIANANRAPNRFSVIMTLSLAVMVSYAAFWILNKIPKFYILRLTFCALLLITLSFEHLSIPLPLTDARIPEICYQIGAEPGHFAILQLPMGWRNSFGTLGSERTQAQYYQAAHHKPIISGNISRNPPFKFEYFRRISLLKSITALELYKEVDAATRERDKELAPELMSLYDVRYLLIFPPIPGRLPYTDTMTKTVDYALEVFPLEPEPFYDRDGVLAYRVIQPTPQTDFTIAFGLEETEMYRGEGWSWNEEIGGVSANWATAQRARVFIPLRQGGNYKMTMAALPFGYQGAPPQKIKIKMNGHPVSELSLTANWAPYEVDIPSTVIRYGLNELTLHFSYLASPQDVLPESSDQRTLAVAVDYVKFERLP